MRRQEQFRAAVLGLAALALLLGGSGRATAGPIIIDFEAQGAGAPSVFTGTVNSPLVIGIATFTGGQLLNHESGPSPDQTAVYATANLAGGYTNPIPIHFSQPVSGFSILVTNLIADNYTVSDNLGGSETLFIAGSSQAVFTLPDVGITSVTVQSAATGGQFDFAIDNVTFTPAAPPVPEPSSLALLSLGGLGLAGWRRWRKRATA